jgi:hypothetical protein
VPCFLFFVAYIAFFSKYVDKRQHFLISCTFRNCSFFASKIFHKMGKRNFDNYFAKTQKRTFSSQPKSLFLLRSKNFSSDCFLKHIMFWALELWLTKFQLFMLISGILVYVPYPGFDHAQVQSLPPYPPVFWVPNPWLVLSYFSSVGTSGKQQRFLMSIHVHVLPRPRWCIDMSRSCTGSCCPDKSRCSSGRCGVGTSRYCTGSV